MESYHRSSPRETNFAGDRPGGPLGGPYDGPLGGPLDGPLGGPLGGPQGYPMDIPMGGPSVGGPMGGPMGGPLGGPMGGPIGTVVGVAASAATPAIASPNDIVHLSRRASVDDGSGIQGDHASAGGVVSQTRSHGPPGQPLDGLLTSTMDPTPTTLGGRGAAGWSMETARAVLGRSSGRSSRRSSGRSSYDVG